MEFSESSFLPRERLQDLIELLIGTGYEVIGPTIRQDAIVLDRIHHADELPSGCYDVQQPASYRVVATAGRRQFDFNVGPQSWKRYLFPPQVSIGGARLDDSGWHFSTSPGESTRYALLGVRACELAAIAVQDRVFIGDSYVDPHYRQLRDQALIIVVECSRVAPTCFCDSMGTGPSCQAGFDLAMTELEEGFLVQPGSPTGGTILTQLNCQPRTPIQQRQAEEQIRATESALTHGFDAEGVNDLLMGNLDHVEWDQVAQRCLSCTNCTMVCPTCFCSTVEEVTDLDQTHVDRVRRWDSCFNQELSYTCGGTARPNIRSRYRQWLTHKLATWHDQFGTSGCVGCGRCITWCPVGIDIREEVDRIRVNGD